MRKLLLIISVFIICFSCAPATFAEQAYSDEKCSEWAYYYIKDAESPLYDIMPQKMYGGDFTASVTRQELCELIECIHIYDKTHLQITFNFKDEYEQALITLSEYKEVI